MRAVRAGSCLSSWTPMTGFPRRQQGIPDRIRPRGQRKNRAPLRFSRNEAPAAACWERVRSEKTEGHPKRRFKFKTKWDRYFACFTAAFVTQVTATRSFRPSAGERTSASLPRAATETVQAQIRKPPYILAVRRNSPCLEFSRFRILQLGFSRS
jgi:hypothetical protein